MRTCLYLSVGLTAVLTLGMGFIASARGGQLVLFGFDNKTPSPNAGSIAAHLSVDPVTLGNGLTSRDYISGNPDTGFALSAGNWGTTASPDPEAYYEFTLTPDSGNELTLTSISFDLRASSSGPDQWQLYSSQDNYAAPINSAVSFSNDGKWYSQSLDFGGSFADLNDSITLQLFGLGSMGNAGTLSIDNLSFAGDVLAPEPAESVIPVAVGLVLWGWRRRAKGVRVRAVTESLSNERT